MALMTAKDRWTIVLIVIVIAMGIEIAYLMYQNQRLKSIIQDPRKYFKTLSEDEVVPSFTALDIDGNDVTIRYSPDAPYTILFWFAPTCSSCEENINFWNQISREYGSDRLRYLGMCTGSPEEAREFADEYGLEFSVICASDPFIVNTYKGNLTPQTVLISSEGSVAGVWPGVLTDDQKDMIVEVLDRL